MFNVFNDTELLEQDPVDSWDVMDQFPPYNRHSEDGGLVFAAGAASTLEDVQSKASPPTLPKYV